jgi:hypothetical protein
MHLIENAPSNRGKSKKYIGVCGNLTAFGCKISKDYGFDDIIAFEPKTALIPHYQKTLGAVLISDRRMAIFEEDSQLLQNKYFPETEAES